MDKRLTVGVSGASGAPLAVELLRQLRENHPEVETHLIVTRGGEMTLRQETGMTLEELRALVLAARESPLSTVHLRNLYEASQLGAVIVPPMLTYYDHPVSIEDCTRRTAGRILAQFGLDSGGYEWEGMDETV